MKIMHRVGRLEIKISYHVNASYSSFMSLQSLGLAAIARYQIQMARLPTVGSYAPRPSFQKSTHLNMTGYATDPFSLSVV